MELKKYKRMNNQRLPEYKNGVDWGGVGVNAI
jgi:hypothetical protein